MACCVAVLPRQATQHLLGALPAKGIAGALGRVLHKAVLPAAGAESRSACSPACTQVHSAPQVAPGGRSFTRSARQRSRPNLFPPLRRARPPQGPTTPTPTPEPSIEGASTTAPTASAAPEIIPGPDTIPGTQAAEAAQRELAAAEAGRRQEGGGGGGESTFQRALETVADKTKVSRPSGWLASWPCVVVWVQRAGAGSAR